MVGSCSWHSNVEPGTVAVNATDSPLWFVGPSGPPVIVVSGGVSPFTVNVRVAGLASRLPAPSQAVTVSV